jgi:hypothetical protein
VGCGTRKPWPVEAHLRGRRRVDSGGLQHRLGVPGEVVPHAFPIAGQEKPDANLDRIALAPVQVVGAKEKRIGRLRQPRRRLLLLGAVSRVSIPLQHQPLRRRVHVLRPVVNRVARTTRPVYAEKAVPNDSRYLVKPFREERLRPEQPSVASRGIRIGRLVPVPLRGGYPLEWCWGSRASHRTRDDRARRLEEGAGAPASRRWSRGWASSSRATDWAARRVRRRARVWRGHARERWGGRELAAPALGCLLGRTVRGVRKNFRNVMRSCAPRL